MGIETKAFGVLLIVISVTMLFISSPSVLSATDTTSGHSLENASATAKTGFQIFNYLFPFIGVILLIGGVVELWR